MEEWLGSGFNTVGFYRVYNGLLELHGDHLPGLDHPYVFPEILSMFGVTTRGRPEGGSVGSPPPTSLSVSSKKGGFRSPVSPKGRVSPLTPLTSQI